MYEDMNKAVNILLVIALILLFATSFLARIDPFLGKMAFTGIVFCNLGALGITVGKSLGLIKDKNNG